MYNKALIALATSVALSGAAVAADLNVPTPKNDSIETAKPVTIAQDIMFKGSLAPSKSAKKGGASASEIVVSHPGAVFVKVHFSQFNIPEGAYVTVSDVSGQEEYIYDGKTNKRNMTFDRDAGENGFSKFSAMSVFGEKAIVRLIVPEGAVWEKHHGIKIDRFKAGTDSSDEVFKGLNDYQTRSTCGVNERRDVACWQNSHPTEYERTRPVARLLMNGSGLCTGWRVGDNNHMFTNEHCVNSQSELQNTEVWFNYQTTSCNGTVNSSQTVKVTGDQLLKMNYNLDYTLFTVNNFSSIQSFGNFGLDVRTPTQNERIYIPQHGSGNPKELSIEDDQSSTGLCKIDAAIEDGRASNTDTGYMCDTIGGSSGSPVLAASSNKVIALHHFGGCTNQGVRMDLIWPEVSSYFGGQVPDGDNNSGGGGNNNPVAVISDNCNGLTCTFDGSGSTDSDGSIASYSWDINGTSYSGSSATHTFPGNGSYTATLTVTDNEGATGSNSTSVNVNDGSGNVLVSGVSQNVPNQTTGNDVVYTIDTTQPATTTEVVISGGSGDADLYVRSGSAPTDSSYECRPYAAGNNETCTVTNANPTTVYARVKAYSSFSGVSIVATNSVGGGSDYPKTGLSGSNRAMDLHTYTATSTGSVTVSISGGTGDADLYTRKGSEPTTSSYDCRPYRSGNSESCTASLSNGEVLHIGIRAYSNYTGVTLDVQ